MRRFKIHKGFITQKMGSKLIIFDAEKSVLYTLNETAAYIFSKLKLGWEEKKIVESMAKRYKIEEKKAEKDVGELLTDLEKKKIISS